MFRLYNIFFRTKDNLLLKHYNKLGILFIVPVIIASMLTVKLTLIVVLLIAAYYASILNLSLINMNGIFSTKDARNDYLKFSNNSAKLLKSVMVADFIRRIFPTTIFAYVLTLFAYECNNIPAIICTIFLILGVSQFIVFFGYFIRGSEKCGPILILGSFIMGVVLYIFFVNEIKLILFGVLAVIGLMLIIAKFIISFRKVDELYG